MTALEDGFLVKMKIMWGFQERKKFRSFFICERTKCLDFYCMFATLQKNSEGNSLSGNKEKKKNNKKKKTKPTAANKITQC